MPQEIHYDPKELLEQWYKEFTEGGIESMNKLACSLADDAVTRKMVEEFVAGEEEHCGCVYDPEKGDPKHGIEPGTRFEDLPEEWKCQRCRKGKDMFRPV